jgi:hypothetical protein
VENLFIKLNYVSVYIITTLSGSVSSYSLTVNKKSVFQALSESA